MPLAAIAFGNDNRWLAWTGNWRKFESPFDLWKFKPEDIQKLSPETRELIANRYNLWIARTGSPWRDMPHEFGHWHVCPL